MLSFVEGDDAAAADVFASMVSAGPQFEIATLQREMGLLIDSYQRRRAGAHLTEVFERLLAVVRDQGLRMPTEFVVLLTTLAVVEGVAMKIAPDYRLADSVAAHAGASIPDRFDPDRLKRTALRTLARHSRLLEDLPVGVSRALRRASEGEFRLAVRPSEYERFLDRVSDLVVRLSLSVLLAAFVVGCSVIVALQPDNRAVNATAEVVLVVATVVAIWWMISLGLGYRRRRR